MELSILAAAEAALRDRTSALEGVEAADERVAEAVRLLLVAGATVPDIADALHLSCLEVHQLIAGRGLPREEDGLYPVYCSFCGRTPKAARLIASEDPYRRRYVCVCCLPILLRVVRSAGQDTIPAQTTVFVTSEKDIEQRRCHFCRKGRDTSEIVTSNRQVNICLDCLRASKEAADDYQ